MNEEQMPAAEASKYELAFHVLPTVAEGEVATIFEKIKKTITKAKGEVFAEEAPERFDLAYDIVKYLEGRNRKFSSAYFGWVRFSVASEAIEAIAADIDSMNELLRHLLIKLTKVEEEHPFMFHEALEHKKVVTIEADDSEKNDEETEADDSDSETEDESADEQDGEDTKDKV